MVTGHNEPGQVVHSTALQDLLEVLMHNYLVGTHGHMLYGVAIEEVDEIAADELGRELERQVVGEVFAVEALDKRIVGVLDLGPDVLDAKASRVEHQLHRVLHVVQLVAVDDALCAVVEHVEFEEELQDNALVRSQDSLDFVRAPAQRYELDAPAAILELDFRVLQWTSSLVYLTI